MKKETVLIAAYGTLRSGECNERFCRNAISRRSATISGTLYDTGWGFPAFVPKGKKKVSVELIEIPIRDWADVDRLEGISPPLRSYSDGFPPAGRFDCSGMDLHHEPSSGAGKSHPLRRLESEVNHGKDCPC